MGDSTAPRIVVLGTGGTIAGLGAGQPGALPGGYRAGQVPVAELLGAIPALPAAGVETEQLAQVDSKDMDDALWRALALRCADHLARPEVIGLVVTHGTDTLEETAWFLQRVLEPAKPVVLASAMRPADAVLADGPQNLLDALTVAQSRDAHGVLAVAAGCVHSAREVRKRHPYRLDAIASGEAGPLGVVEDGRLRMLQPWPPRSGSPAPLLDLVRNSGDAWPRVAIVMSHAGADGAVVDALRQAGVDGIVVAGTGNGTVHGRLEAALIAARDAGVRIVRSTRCAEGQVLPQADDRFAASPLPAVKARIDLVLELLAASGSRRGSGAGLRKRGPPARVG